MKKTMHTALSNVHKIHSTHLQWHSLSKVFITATVRKWKKISLIKHLAKIDCSNVSSWSELHWSWFEKLFNLW
jgi:hypothetical protein